MTQDIRTQGDSGDLVLSNVHSGGVHTVAWAPVAPPSPHQSGHHGAHPSHTLQDDNEDADTTLGDHVVKIDAHEGPAASVAISTIHSTGGDAEGAEGDSMASSSSPSPSPSLHVWLSQSQPLLMTAGHDPVIKLFDLRRPLSPLHELRGHASAHARAFKTILPPRFLGPGVVVAQGEGSPLLSMYCTRTGACISRGEMPDQVLAVACNTTSPCRGVPSVAASCRRGQIYVLDPVGA